MQGYTKEFASNIENERKLFKSVFYFEIYISKLNYVWCSNKCLKNINKIMCRAIQKSIHGRRCMLIFGNMISIVLKDFLLELNLSLICDVYKILQLIFRIVQKNSSMFLSIVFN